MPRRSRKINKQTETKSTQAAEKKTPSTQTDNLARIATALERIADIHQHLLGYGEDQHEVLREINQEIYLFSQRGFGM